MSEKTDFISVGEMAVGLSENMTPQNTDFIGRELLLYYENGDTIRYKIIDEDTLKWETIEGESKGNTGVASFYCASPRENIYLIDYVASYGDTKRVSLVLDIQREICLTVIGILPTEEEANIPMWVRARDKMPLTAVKAEYSHASIGKAFTASTSKFERTSDIVGLRSQYTYASRELYEHIYLNEKFSAWQCIRGNERGNADVEQTQYYKISEKLILYVWQEKVVPTHGLVLEDFEALRSYGAIYGYEGFDFNRVINIPVGSYIKELNTTTFDYILLESQQE
jgi:hypothetical protein